MSYKAFAYFEGKMHEVLLASLKLKSLEEKVVEIINNTKNGNDKTVNSTPHFKIIDNSSQEITNDEQLKTAFKAKDIFFFVHLIDNNNDERKYPEDEKKEEEEEEGDDEHHSILNPLVLLTGAAKYKNLKYLPGVKVDLMKFRNLFEDVYGYE
ncbi:hypothetical protein RFI_35188, partial [Reticulomyxa filosa]